MLHEKPCGSTASFFVEVERIPPAIAPRAGPGVPFSGGWVASVPLPSLPAICGGFVRAVPKMSSDRPALMASHFRL